MIELIIGIAIPVVSVLLSWLLLASRNKEDDFRHSLVNLKKLIFISFIVALLSGIATYFLSHYYYNADVLSTYRWQWAVSAIIPIAAIDLTDRIIPNKLLLVLLVVAVVITGVDLFFNIEYYLSVLGTALIGSLVGGGVFLLGAALAKKGVGAGDIKLFFVLGLLLGLRGIFSVLLISLLVSALTGLFLIVFKKKKIMDELPLAPFAGIGVLVSILLGV